MANCDLVSVILSYAEDLMPTYVYVKDHEEWLSPQVQNKKIEDIIPDIARTRCGTAVNLIIYSFLGPGAQSNPVNLNITALDQLLDTSGFIVIFIDTFMTYKPEYINLINKYHTTYLNARSPVDQAQIIGEYSARYEQDHGLATSPDSIDGFKVGIKFPGHMMCIVKNSTPRNDEDKYLILQSYVLNHTIKGYTTNRSGIKQLITNYVNFGRGDIFTKKDEDLWLEMTGSQLRDLDGRSLVGYSKHYRTFVDLKYKDSVDVGCVVNILNMNTSTPSHLIGGCFAYIMTILAFAIEKASKGIDMHIYKRIFKDLLPETYVSKLRSIQNLLIQLNR